MLCAIRIPFCAMNSDRSKRFTSIDERSWLIVLLSTSRTSGVASPVQESDKLRVDSQFRVSTFAEISTGPVSYTHLTLPTILLV